MDLTGRPGLCLDPFSNGQYALWIADLRNTKGGDHPKRQASDSEQINQLFNCTKPIVLYRVHRIIVCKSRVYVSRRTASGQALLPARDSRKAPGPSDLS